jgi:hypothetical protein
MLCHQEAPKIKKFVDESAEVPKDFIAAKGNVEITIDATKVNTLGGWRDMKIGIDSKRLLETVGCSLGCGQTQRNGGAMFRPLLRPLGKILDAGKLRAGNVYPQNFDAPCAKKFVKGQKMPLGITTLL